MNSAILEKVRKLRALASSTNVHEAAAAAATASRLIQENDLDEADLGDSAEEEPGVEILDDMGVRVTHWKSSLSHYLEEAHGCTGWVERTRDYSTRAKSWRVRVKIAGRPSDVATVRYLYAWLTAEIVRLCEASGQKGRTARNSFCIGAVVGVRAALATTRTEVRAHASEAALVKLDARLVRAEAARPTTCRPAKGSDPALDPDAFLSGVESGRSIHHGARLGHDGAKLLGGGT